jgi:hypothetical protein
VESGEKTGKHDILAPEGMWRFCVLIVWIWIRYRRRG